MPLSRLLAGALLTACAVAPLPLHAIPASLANDYQLAWWDEFDGDSLNLDYWGHSLGPRHDAINTEDAVTVADGSAVITSYTENGVHHTGIISTKQKFTQPFGYYEARIQFNGAPGMWSAFWLMPNDLPNTLPAELLGRPDIAGVEVDIVEHRKVKMNGSNIENVINAALHWNGYNDAAHQVAHIESVQPTLSNGTWHTYGLLWTPEGYTVYFDDQPIWTTSAAVSHRPANVLLSSEIRHAKWAGNIPAGGYGSRAASTVKMLTDYVRVYELKPSASGQTPSVAHPFPGRIEAENFDQGGRHVAYYEKAGSGPGGLNSIAVDVVNNAASSGGKHVANLTRPEWLEHTVAAQTHGYYYADLTLASAAGDGRIGSMLFSIDGVALGTINVQSTGGWRNFTPPTLLKVDAPATLVTRIEHVSILSHINMEAEFDAIDFVPLGNVVHLREAEGAVLGGGATAADNGAASGGQFADLRLTGASARWTGVDGFNGGAATLTLRYFANGVIDYARQCELLVNGVSVGTLSLPGTPVSGFRNIQHAVTLNAGAANTIELRNAGVNGRQLGIDYLITSKATGNGAVVPGPTAFPTVRPAANRLADGETAVTLVDDDFTNGTLTGWSTSHERLLEPVAGVTLANVTGSGLNGRALSVASTAQFRSALRAFDPVTLAIGDSLTVTFDYRFPDGVWSNANGLWAGFADSSQTILRDLAQPDTSSNRTLRAFYATANPAGQAGGSYLKINQGNGAGSTTLGTAYGTAASGTTKRSATINFTRTGANTLEIVSDLGRFGLTPATITENATTGWFTFDRFFVIKGAGSANLDFYIDNVRVVHHAGSGQ